MLLVPSPCSPLESPERELSLNVVAWRFSRQCIETILEMLKMTLRMKNSLLHRQSTNQVEMQFAE